MIARALIDDKFWLIERDGMKIGTLQKLDAGYTSFIEGEKKIFQSLSDVIKTLNVEFQKKVKVVDTEESYNVMGYPCSEKPYNEALNIAKKLPIYTKTPTTKSLYAAGYYNIRFEKGWSEAFCPKLITLEKNFFRGPFKSRMEARAVLTNEKSD